MNIEKINVGGNLYDICDAKARAMISDEHDQGKSYAAGDLCIHDNKLHAAIEPTTGAWDGTKWEEKTIAEVIAEQNSNIFGFPDYDNLVHTIDTAGASWQATENVWSQILVNNSSGSGYTAQVYIDGKAVLSVSDGDSAESSFIPVAKGQTISTRKEAGMYGINLYGMK